jgi:hypothetical protein
MWTSTSSCALLALDSHPTRAPNQAACTPAAPAPRVVHRYSDTRPAYDEEHDERVLYEEINVGGNNASLDTRALLSYVFAPFVVYPRRASSADISTHVP